MAEHINDPWTDQPQPDSACVEVLAEVWPGQSRVVIARAYGYKPYRMDNQPSKAHAAERADWEETRRLYHAHAVASAQARGRLIAAAPEYENAARNLLANADLAPDPRMEGATDCYLVTLEDIEALEAAVRKSHGDKP